jgi:IS30 family transposase
MSGGSVASETEAPDLLQRKPDGLDVGTLAKRRVIAAHRPTRLPHELYKSLTWDRGTEMANHKRFTIATDIAVYFCDPPPWATRLE